MFLVNPINHWKLIIVLAIVEWAAILAWGYTLRKIIKLKYRFPTSYHQLFKCQNYNLRPDFDINKCSKNSLVLVRFDSDRTIKSETFYTSLGNWIYFEYDNGQKSRSNGLMISSLIIAAFFIPGALAIVAFNFLKITTLFVEVDSNFLLDFAKIARLSFGIPMWSGMILIYTPWFKDESNNLSNLE